MQLQTASRKEVKIKMALQSPPGAGKTMSSLLIAYGLCDAWNRVAVLDTERGASLYAHLGNYQVISLHAPFTPEQYIKAIDYCLKEDIAVLIIDSISQEWSGSGGILDIHAAATGSNSYTNWMKVMPRHNAFVEKLMQADIHIIVTIRSKIHYELAEKNGKQVPVKAGFKAITHQAMPFEFSVLLHLDRQHQATAEKDRTQLFQGQGMFIPGTATGRAIKTWLSQDSAAEVQQRIQEAATQQELLALYNSCPAYQETLKDAFAERNKQLLLTEKPTAHGTINNAR